MLERTVIDHARAGYKSFLDSLSNGSSFKLTAASDASPYARCFAIFGLHLLQCNDRLSSNSELLAKSIRNDLDLLRDKRREAGFSLKFDKAYLQLLTFSLSALAVLGRLKSEPLEDHVLPLVSEDVETDLGSAGALDGVPQSGNQAMFLAIMLSHARDYLGIDVSNSIELWESLHLKSMNEFGYWGPSKTMSHLQFQNGYHQYEMLEYFQAENTPWGKAADNVALLADKEGHYSPYPGGGGCYDYDAVYILTSAGFDSVMRHKDLLLLTAETILVEQNADGGFCESHRIRPRSFDNMLLSFKHAFAAKGEAKIERIRQAITLLRPKHSRIHTHWSQYSRCWNESDLWDSWFRMLTIARIDIALEPVRINEWGFIDYPGIGFHHLLRNR